MKIHGTEIVLDYKTLNIFADGQISDMYEQFISYVENIHLFLFFRSYDSLMVSQNMVSNKVHWTIILYF